MASEMAMSNQLTPQRQVDRSEVEFDQWAKAVRQQMVDALKRRGRV